MNSLSYSCKKTEKEEMKLNVKRRNEIIEIKAEMIKIEKNNGKKIKDIKIWFIKRINEILKP